MDEKERVANLERGYKLLLEAFALAVEVMSEFECDGVVDFHKALSMHEIIYHKLVTKKGVNE